MTVTAADPAPTNHGGGPAHGGRATARVLGADLRRIAARFWPETESLRGRLALSLALVVLAPALSTSAIWLFKVLIDKVVVPHDFHLFPALAGAYLGIAVLQGAVAFTDQYVSTWVSERFVLRLRAKVFAHLHRLPLGFLDRHPLGDLLSRLTGDISAIEDVLITGAAQALTYGVRLVLFAGALFVLDWRLAVAALVATPGFLLAARHFATRIKTASREKRRRVGAITSVAEESLGNAALVRAYDQAEQEARRFRTQAEAALRAQLAATRLQALFAPLTDLLEVLGVLAVIGLAVFELASGRITIGGLLSFVTYLTQMYSPLQGIGQLANQVHAASAGAERVIELLDQRPDVLEPADPRPLGRARGALRLRGVDFHYPDSDAPGLRGLDLDIPAGQTVALVGASGAGKSTLVKLLLRFYDPDAGSVALDGVDLRELATSDLYRNIAVLPQETVLFDGTIRDNIRWGRPDAGDEQVLAAAVAADADEFVRDLPDGYDTQVGQRGRRLSGGQRQRIAIARAMIRDAPVLLLDEPTTGLDAQSTERVLEPLHRLMKGRTTLVITHDLKTSLGADRIVHLADGKIRGDGAHAELLASDPGYAQLYRLNQEVSQVEEQPTDAIVAPRKRPAKMTVSWVRYQYPGHTADALPEVSFEIPTGGCVAVVGPRGCGKSTLLRLLRGQLEPTSGTILFEGQDNWQLDPARRHRIALAPKDGMLLDGSIARNIAHDRPSASLAEVVEAAAGAGAAQFIDSFADGYETQLGVDGHRITEGQRRRLLIARALLNRPEVLLLDEPTANLASSERHEMLGQLCQLAMDYTLVLTTHDPLVIALADRMIRLMRANMGAY